MTDRLGIAATVATTLATLAVVLYVATGPGSCDPDAPCDRCRTRRMVPR